VVVAAFKIDDHATTSMAKNFQAGVFAAVVDSGNIQTPQGSPKATPQSQRPLRGSIA